MTYERRAFIAASGQVLCNHLPENYDKENWKSENGETIDEWVVSNAWEPFEYWSAEQLWKQISDVSHALKQFHRKETDESR
jgi:hypothetical protein